LQELNCSLQDFVPTIPDALDRGGYLKMRHQANALQLSAVGMPHVVPGETDAQFSGQHERRNVTVRARAMTADESDPTGGLEEESRVLRRALRPG